MELLAITLGCFVPAMILARLALWSARTRLGRTRRTAEALTEDVVTLLQKGERDRAGDVAASHGTPFATGLVRVLKSLHSRRSRIVEETGVEWRRGPTRAPGVAYGCFLWLLAGLATIYGIGIVFLALGFSQVHGLAWLVSAAPSFLAGGAGLYDLWSTRRGLVEAQLELGATFYALLRRVASAMEPREDR